MSILCAEGKRIFKSQAPPGFPRGAEILNAQKREFQGQSQYVF